jgi:3-phosphoshikimate 1-carboxyvinyltransferase
MVLARILLARIVLATIVLAKIMTIENNVSETREISPVDTIDACVSLPGSKYIANRLLPLCALAKSESSLTNVVNNDDINASIQGLLQLGYQIEHQESQLKIKPRQSGITQPAEIYTAHSGTFSRFVSAVAALESHPVSINCSEKMATRPMQEIFTTLKQLGVSIDSPNDCLPAVIKGPMLGGDCRLDASRSSQYLSALLIVAPTLRDGLSIELDNELASSTYIDMTIQLMQKMGVEVKRHNNQFMVSPGQSYQGIDYHIPGDPMSASYFMAATAIAGGRMVIENFDFDSLQGEAKFYQVLEQMQVTMQRKDKNLIVTSDGHLNAIEIDMEKMPDAVQTLAAVACFAKGTTRITNIENLAYKESNRIEDTAREIRKTGIQVETGKDYMAIQGGQPKSAEIDTYDDHRMAMSMALLGIKKHPSNKISLKVHDAQVVNKSFPTFWDCLNSIGVKSFLCE